MHKLHSKFFIFGFLYYLILPLFVGVYSLFVNYPGMSRWHDDFLLLNENDILIYFLTISTFLFSFFLFDVFLKFINKKIYFLKTDAIILHKELYWVNLICIPLVIFSVFISIFNFSLLIKGYAVDHHQVAAVKGMLTTSTMVLLYVALVNYISKYDKLITKPVLYCVIFSSFILLFSGTRMYSLIVILAFLGNYITYRTINKKLLFSISAGLFVLLLLVGLLRMGSDVKLDLLAYIFLAEPIFTWWSASTYLSGNEFNFLSTPISFFSSVINFIPSFLLPNKSMYMVDLSELATFEAPLGANSIYVGIQADFGYFFGLIYLFFLGVFYTVLNMMARSNMYIRAYYLCCCAVLPFQFFRDGFFIVNKQVMWNFLIVPLFIIVLSKIILIIVDRKNKV